MAKLTDTEIQVLLSKKLYQIEDAGLQTVVRGIIFTYAHNMDWQKIYVLMRTWMPELVE